MIFKVLIEVLNGIQSDINHTESHHLLVDM